MNPFDIESLKTRLEYLKSSEYEQQQKEGVLKQVCSFLSNRYNCKITFDNVKERFEITNLDDSKEAELLNDLKDMGL